MKPINVSPRIYDRNDEAKTRIVVNQGGSSSGKTFSILQLLLQRAWEKRLHISVCAITLPHLKKGAIRDFINILHAAELYDLVNHNKTENIFELPNGSILEFFSVDIPAKARGPRRDILFVNECNLIPQETFIQLALRTKDQIFIDYNPADENHWIYEDVLTRPSSEVTFIQSTFLDNSFLDPEIVKEIERLKDVDENLWKIYGLGQRGQLKGLIYPPWDLVDEMPDPSNFDVFYGLDFGWVHPTALVRCYLADSRILFVEELLYKSYMTNADIIEVLKSNVTNQPIYADVANPQAIAEIRKAGFNVKPADKSVKNGIERVQRLKINVVRTGPQNIMKERGSYKWREDSAGNLFEEPVKFKDDLMDALRYAVHSHMLKPSGRYSISVI